MSNDLHVMRIKGGGFLNLKCVNIKLGQGEVQIGGDNWQGKSNILTLIQLLKGKKYMPEVPKNKDSRSGKFEVLLADREENVRFAVEFSFTEKDSYMRVKDADGKKQGVEVLKSLLSPCLNPWEFFQDANATGLGATERRRRAVEVIEELMTFDFSPDEFTSRLGLHDNERVQELVKEHGSNPVSFLDALDEYFTESRKKWKEKKGTLTGSLETLKAAVPEDKRDMVKEIDVAELMNKQRALDTLRTNKEKADRDVEAAKVSIENRRESLKAVVTTTANRVEQAKAALETVLAEAKARVQESEELVTSAEITHKDTLEHVSELPDYPEAEADELTAQIATVQETNALARKAADLKAARKELAVVSTTTDDRERVIKEIRQEKLDLYENADMPVANITVKDGNIYKDGIPFGQDSEAEGLMDSFKIGMAKFDRMSPDAMKLKTMIIPNASLLSTKTRAMLLKLAEEHGIQVILELVMDKAQDGVIFVEDGVAVNVDKGPEIGDE